MQLVLTEDVQHLGKQGELVEVRSGYGRNYLLPRGLATVPTAHNLRLLERYKQRVCQARESRIADLRVLAEQIQRVPHITIEANANEEGHLYGSVTGVEVSKALKGKNLKVEAEMVKLRRAHQAVRPLRGPAGLGLRDRDHRQSHGRPAQASEKK